MVGGQKNIYFAHTNTNFGCGFMQTSVSVAAILCAIFKLAKLT